jgi:hypothetical protein
VTTMEAYSTSRTGTWRDRLAAAVGLLLALVLLRLPFRLAVRVARWARRVGCRPLSPARAAVLVAAVRHAGRWWPGRVACLETSLAAHLAAALLGRELTWCVGVRFSPPPTAFHAWAELDGQPVGEYTVAGWHYHAALAI